MNAAPRTMPPDPALDNECIKTLRFLSVDAVQKADSGHPGLPMGAASMAYVLWTRFLKHNPANPEWFDRDRFVLSPGHGSMLLYSLLHLTGYDLPLEQIKQFRQWGSMTLGHPERGVTQASRRPPGRSVKASATAWVWRWPKRTSLPATTAPASRSSIISPTGSSATAT